MKSGSIIYKADASVYALKPFNLKILKQDVDKYLDSDEDIQRAKHKVDYLQTTTDFLDRTIMQISNRTFTIKNAIECCKFTKPLFNEKFKISCYRQERCDVYLKIDADESIRRELEFFTFEKLSFFKFMPQYRNRVWDAR